MDNKRGKNKRYSVWANLFILCLINTMALSSPGPGLSLKETPCHLLRPQSYQNGTATKMDPFSAAPPSLRNPGDEDSGPGETTVSAYDGAVAFWNIEADGQPAGPEILVPAGKSAKSSAPGRLTSLDEKQLQAVGKEFTGSYLHFAKWQLWVLHITAMEKSKDFQPFTRNKVIEFNTDLFPDFDPDLDSGQTRLVKAILETAAYEILQYKKDPRFFSHRGKIYIDFVSRDGSVDGKIKRDKVVELFKNLSDDIKKYQPEEMLYSPEIGPADRLTITHQGDSAEFANPALILKTGALSEKTVMVYPWDTLIKLSAGILSIDRTKPLTEQGKAYQAVRELFKELIEILDIEPKEELRQGLDDILVKLLSSNPVEYIEAARKLILPPVQKLDLEEVDDINRIMKEVAKWA